MTSGVPSDPDSGSHPVPASAATEPSGAEVRPLRPVTGPAGADAAAIAALEQQVEALRADLTLKDTFALRIRADLRAAEVERDALAREVAWLRERIAAIDEDAGRLRAEEAALRAVVDQPGYRVLERANRALARVPALQRAVRRVTRLAARDR